jgi:hypothetical protein
VRVLQRHKGYALIENRDVPANCDRSRVVYDLASASFHIPSRDHVPYRGPNRFNQHRELWCWVRYADIEHLVSPELPPEYGDFGL